MFNLDGYYYDEQGEPWRIRSPLRRINDEKLIIVAPWDARRIGCNDVEIAVLSDDHHSATILLVINGCTKWRMIHDDSPADISEQWKSQEKSKCVKLTFSTD